jgi:hypothetical protein
MNVYIEYQASKGYYFGLLKDKKIIWDSRYFRTLFDAKHAVYKVYPNATISCKE